MAPRDQWVAEATTTVCTPDERAVLAEATAIMLRLVDFGGGVAPVEP
jgi:hypothetical protein